MGPKSFITCYVCFKKFGSKSIAFHEPNCLEKWRSSNKNLPNDKRTPAPVKPTIVCNDNTPDHWFCSNCFESVPAKRKGEHILICSHSFSCSNQSGNCLKAKGKSGQISKSGISKAKNLKSSDNYFNAKSFQSSDRYLTVKNLQSGDRYPNAKNLKSSDNDSDAKNLQSGEYDLNTKNLHPADNYFNARDLQSGDNGLKAKKLQHRYNYSSVKNLQSSDNDSNDKNLQSGDIYSNVKNPRSCERYSKAKSLQFGGNDSNAKSLQPGDNDLNAKNLQYSDNYSNLKSININSDMTGVVKAEFSPKKGKENKNSSNNHIPVPSVVRKNARNDSKDNGDKPAQTEAVYYEVVEVTSTSDRSVRPQTKILRRPTPNLNHPVIQFDSDDSSGDSSCSDKSKDDNPKRLKMGSDSELGGDKPKNFILYNKNNVEKNTIKSSPKERASTNNAAPPIIPNPCNSCNRSLAPERLHSHAKKDSRGLMYRKSPSLDLKIESTSAQQKSAEKSPTMAQQKIPEIPSKSPNKDVKMASPHQKIPEILSKSPSMDVKMSSPRKKVSEHSENTKMAATSPQQKLSRLPKPPSLEIKPIHHPKISTPDAHSKPLISSGKSIPKLTKLDKPSTDADTQQKQTSESSDKHLDTKVASPAKKKVSRSNPYRILNKIPVQKELNVLKSSEKDTTEDTNADSLTVPEPAPNAKDDHQELEKACYICFKVFKASVLLMHESRCLENWKRENNSLTPNLRQLPPRRPTSDDDDEFDDDLVCTSMESQLVPCDLCGRTFFPERLPVHSRVCKSKSSPSPLKRAVSLRERSASSTEGEEVKPAVYVPCYVCGRNYGSWVISMHEQQCLKKWRRENDKLPDEERKEEPKKYPDSPDEDVASLAELGNNAWESHLQRLVPCPLCSRTFFPDRLGVHKRSCKGPPTTSSRRPRSKMGA